jgi:phosphatidate cytidylyltransferase
MIGLLTSALGQIGDLLESAIKRECGIKDMGTILPGHGGILDRFDSVLLASLSILFMYAFILRL